MHREAPQPAQGRWRARRIQSAVLRAVVLLVPVAAGIGTGVTISRLVPPPGGPAEIGWWALLLAASGLSTEVTARLARRLLPLAILLKLTLIFPDRAPSRLAMARRAGSIRNLEERVRHAREHGVDDDPARAAETILELVAALSAHDRRTRGHSERVRAFTDLLAEAAALPEESRDRLRWSALLHDIGKLEVPGRILNKAGKPDPHEWETLRRHPDEGARLAAPLLPWLGEWGLAIEQHHERFDGRGYPRGLRGADLSRGARILAVTDSFETMTATRSYRKPMSTTAAREELARMAGSQFDPVVVRSFLSVSLGRLWWVTGPMSWLAQLPLVAPGTQAARVAAAAATKVAVGLAAVGVSGGLLGPRGHTSTGNHAAAIGGAANASHVTSHLDSTKETEGAAADEAPLDQGDDGPADAADGSEPGGQGPADAEPDDAGPGGSDPDGGTDGSGSGGDGSGGDGGSSGGSDEDSGVIGGLTDTVDDTADTLGDTVDDLGQTVDETADDLTDAVGDLLGGAGGTLGL